MQRGLTRGLLGFSERGAMVNNLVLMLFNPSVLSLESSSLAISPISLRQFVPLRHEFGLAKVDSKECLHADARILWRIWLGSSLLRRCPRHEPMT